MREWAHDYELQQGKNVFAAAAQTQGLERLIYSALLYTTEWSGGKFTHVYHFDSEGRAVDYAKSRYPDLMKKTSVIQIGLYLSNMLLMPQYQPRKVRAIFRRRSYSIVDACCRMKRRKTAHMSSKLKYPATANSL